MSLLQNEYNERLAEKLQRQANKRDNNPAFAEELQRLQSVEGVTPRKRERVTENKKHEVKES